jgi:transcriptional regulator with XRE-family HTH domain
MDRTYYAGIERGERNPSVRNLAKIADALEVPISELFAEGLPDGQAATNLSL